MKDERVWDCAAEGLLRAEVSPEHQALVSSDVDGGGRSAQRWSMGLELPRKMLLT